MGPSLKSVFEDDVDVGELSWARPGILGFFTYRDHEGNDVVLGMAIGANLSAERQKSLHSKLRKNRNQLGKAKGVTEVS